VLLLVRGTASLWHATRVPVARFVVGVGIGEAAVLGTSALAIEHVLSPEVVEAASEALAAADAAAEAESGRVGSDRVGSGRVADATTGTAQRSL
jgi:hypothetical protein